MTRIAVFGAGYVGLVSGACFADLGHEVVVRDVVPERIDGLRAGRIPIHEPGLDDVIARAGDRLRYTLDVGEALDGAELAFVAVGTPPTYSGDADLSAIWTVVDELPDDASTTLVMKSTVPPGTGEKVRRTLDARGLGGVGYVSNPEFLAEGTAVRDFMHPSRVVDRGVRARGRRAGGRALRAARCDDRADGRRLRGDDQARVERVSLDADQLHQRDRERLRARSAPTSSTSRTGSASTSASGRTSSRPASASAAAASRRTSPRSSSSPGTPATTSSCSRR